jgi:hypothetical protein
LENLYLLDEVKRGFLIMERLNVNYTSDNSTYRQHKLVHIFPIFTVAILLTGCAGMMVDAMYRSGATGNTYSEMKDEILPPSKGSGRLYLYRTELSTKTSYGPGNIGGSSKNIAWCDLDGNEFMLLWETFFFVDLPEGQHKISCLSAYMRDVFSNSRNDKLRNTSINEIDISITNSSETFVRLDATEASRYIFQPIITTATNAQSEMLNLPLLEEEHRHRK